MNVAVVVPTIREESIRRWLREWAEQLESTTVYVVEDNPEPTINLATDHRPTHLQYACWADIDRDLGKTASWIIPRRTSAIKSYGFLKAYQAGADIIWTLDDDCYPEPGVDYLSQIRAALYSGVRQDTWWNTLEPFGTPLAPRGYPYGIRDQYRPVKVHHGLWSNIPDLDARTQKANPEFRLGSIKGWRAVPTGAMFPMCGMNLAWRREMTPAMYFMLQGQGEPFDRFDDMWAGLMVKRILDHLGWVVTSGGPSIHHAKASDPDVNEQKEAPGIEAHEKLWPLIASARLDSSTPKGCYLELANVVAGASRRIAPGSYWTRLASAMRRWALLFW